MTVPLLDLKAQYHSIRDEVDRAVADVVASQHFVLGPEVEALEAEIADLIGVEHAVGCASGTDALLLSLKALGPEPGDEVILPSFTFFATAGAVWNAGLRPVFCDIDPATFNVTTETVEAVWSERTRALIPVHLFGQMAPMSDLSSLARRRGAFVLEDAAQAIGARQRTRGCTGTDAAGEERQEEWVMAGAAGDAGAFSFFPTKNLGGFGDGGLVSTYDPELAERVLKLRVHGGRQMYQHEMVGTNSRLDALQAAVLRVKLPHLEKWTAARRQNACRYHGALADVEEVRLPETLEGNVHVFNQYTVRAQERDALRTHLKEREIGSGVYYPVPLHLQECFAELGGEPGQLPHTEGACEEVLSLPIFPELGEGR
ncbi:MAG: DegT/DnrJ/EryC1/StrS family aminotransferase, partial [Gemmatimonadota bacterium]